MTLFDATPPPPPLQDTTPLDLDAIERLYGWTSQRLRKWRHRKKGPPFVRVSERVYVYRRCDIEKWLLSRRQVPEPSPPRRAPDIRSTMFVDDGKDKT